MPHSSISPKALGERLQGLRTEHDSSQEDVAQYLGIPRQAVGQMEKGERSIDAIELAKLAALFEVSTDDLLQAGPVFQKAITKQLKTVRFKFNPEKFKQTLLYILSKLGGKPTFGETVLYKVLYFIDFNSFELTGKPITGLTYLRLERGPVPIAELFGDAVEEMQKKNELKRFSQDYFGRTQKRLVALTDPILDVFLISEKEIMDRVIEELGGKNAKQISDYAHGDAPWILTKDKHPIEYPLVDFRQSPYALGESQAPWLNSGSSDILKHLGAMEPEEEEYYRNL